MHPADSNPRKLGAYVRTRHMTSRHRCLLGFQRDSAPDAGARGRASTPMGLEGETHVAEESNTPPSATERTVRKASDDPKSRFLTAVGVM